MARPAGPRTHPRPLDLTRWLEARCRIAAASGLPIINARLIRTSSSDLEKFKASMITSFAAMERDADLDVIAARDLGFDVVRRDLIGDSKRSALGGSIFVVVMGHVPGGSGRRHLGVLLHIGQTIFVYLLSSSRANNLAALTDDRRGNAATEVISQPRSTGESWSR